MDYPSIEKGVDTMDKNVTYIIAILAVAALIVSTYGFVTFSGNISDLDKKLTDDSTSISNIEDQLGDILDQINEYQTNITQMQEELSQYKQVTVVDRDGNVASFTAPPERIVSLAPSLTEILFAIGAGDSVVGVTDYCDYPYNFTAWIEVGNMTSIGNFYGTSAEPIVALDPDLVLATSGSLGAVATLKTLGYAVLVVEGHSINEIMSDILLVGRATYKDAEASALVTGMRARLDAVAAQLLSATTTPKVYYEVWYDPLMSAGPGTYIDEVITLAGGENIFGDASTGWPAVSSEEIIEKNPDVMLFPDSYMADQTYDINDVPDRPGWDVITAVQNDAIYEIVEDTLVRSGPRIVDALEEIAQLIYPELFGEP